MKDPFNPTHEELRTWAYDPNAMAPTQDFDLMVAELFNADLILELTADENCPNRGFFLGCTYLIVGDAVRTKFRLNSKEKIEEFIRDAEKVGGDLLTLFVLDAKDLLENPRKFNYTNWCDSGLARMRLSGN